ncbi:MAG: YARHG domain-containing protein [Bacteroidota bacterium]
MSRLYLLLLPFLLACPSNPPTARLYTEDELSGLSEQELRIKRNDIFARHGYMFRSEDLQAHYSKQNWYRPSLENVDNLLTTQDKQNIQLILRLEEQTPHRKVLRKAMNGHWIKQEYYEGILDKKTPYQLQNLHSGLSEISVRQETTQSDSIWLGVSYGNHEGGSFYIHPTDRAAYFTSEAYANYMSKTLYHFDLIGENQDTFLRAIELIPGQEPASYTPYVKIMMDVLEGEAANSAVSFHSHSLLEGKYGLQTADGSQPERFIQVKQNGELIGFDPFDGYELLTDFIAAGIDGDAIFLKNESVRQLFGIDILPDVLNIYSLKRVDNGDFFEQKDQLLYILTKQE